MGKGVRAEALAPWCYLPPACLATSLGLVFLAPAVRDGPRFLADLYVRLTTGLMQLALVLLLPALLVGIQAVISGVKRKSTRTAVIAAGATVLNGIILYLGMMLGRAFM